MIHMFPANGRAPSDSGHRRQYLGWSGLCTEIVGHQDNKEVIYSNAGRAVMVRSQSGDLSDSVTRGPREGRE